MPPRKNLETATNNENSADSDDSTGCTSLERVPHYNSKAAKPKQVRQRTEAQIKAFEKCRASRAKNVVSRMVPEQLESPPPAPPKLTRQVAEVIEPKPKPVSRRPKVVEIYEEQEEDDEPETIIRRIIKRKPKPRIIEEIEEEEEPAPAPSARPQIIQRPQPVAAPAPAKVPPRNFFH